MRRHLTLQELLEVRDGAGTAAGRAHVTSCDACRAELDRLSQRAAALRALPALRPPRDRWPVVREAYLAGRRRTRLVRWGAVGLAAAAALVLVVARPGFGPPPPEAPPADLATLVERSEQLEAALRTVRRDGRVLSGLAATAIADLEDRIALIDAGIAGGQTGGASAGELEELWRRRVSLLGALVQTHVQRTAYVGY